MIGLLQSWTDDFRWGWNIRRAAPLANALHPLIAGVFHHYENSKSIFEELDEASPVAVGWQNPGHGGGWGVRAFLTFKEWVEALESTRTRPEFPDIRPSFDTVTIDIATAIKRAAAGLDRALRTKIPGEAGAYD